MSRKIPLQQPSSSFEKEFPVPSKVNSPSHYIQGKYETIDVILDITKHLPGDQGYLVGNIIKYLSRYNFKNGQEDIEKAENYLKRLLNLIQKKAEPVESDDFDDFEF